MKTWPSAAVTVPNQTLCSTPLGIRFEAVRLEDSKDDAPQMSNFLLPVAPEARAVTMTRLTLGVLTVFYHGNITSLAKTCG